MTSSELAKYSMTRSAGGLSAAAELLYSHCSPRGQAKFYSLILGTYDFGLIVGSTLRTAMFGITLKLKLIIVMIIN